MPFVPTYLTCLRDLRAYVPTCLCALNYYVPTCLRALIFHLPLCLRAYVPIYIFHVPSCLKLFCAYVRSVFLCLCAYSHSQNILRLTSIPRIAVFLWNIWLFIPFESLKQTSASKTAYLNPTLWGFCYHSWCMRRDNNLRTH